MHRFRFIGSKASDGFWIIRSDEGRHVKNVLRLKDGDRVEVADGRGRWCQGRLKMSTSEIEVIAEHEFSETECSSTKTILIGALKHHWIEDVIPSLVELGVSSIAVYLQKHSEKILLQEKFDTRAHRLVESSCKQCRQPFFPQFCVYPSLESALSSLPQNCETVCLDPSGTQFYRHFQFSTAHRAAIVGSEAGLSDSEITFIKDKSIAILSTGNLILRAFTASILGSSILN